jgi:hypothetical protein
MGQCVRNQMQSFQGIKQHQGPVSDISSVHSWSTRLSFSLALFLANESRSNQYSFNMNTPSTASDSSSDFINDFSTNGLTTNLIFFSNEFPNDDLKDLFRRLHRHSKDKRFTLLATFLENCARVLREETSRLPQHLRELIPPFEDLFTLVDGGQFHLGPLGASMESAFLCALQVAMIIG